MTELHLLNEIADGRVVFTRDEFFNFEEIDRTLRSFTEAGYVQRIVRAVPVADGRVESVVVIGGLTVLGERHRLRLFQTQEARWTRAPEAS